MAEQFTFDLVSPERLLVSEQADMVVVPGSEGDFGVLPLHSPVVALLRPGVIEVHKGSDVRRIFVGGGFAEVNPESCTVLAEEALPVAEIDAGKARQRLSDAETDLNDLPADGDEHERERLEREIKVAEAMVAAKEAA